MAPDQHLTNTLSLASGMGPALGHEHGTPPDLPAAQHGLSFCLGIEDIGDKLLDGLVGAAL
jgi:hypothetical protein